MGNPGKSAAAKLKRASKREDTTAEQVAALGQHMRKLEAAFCCGGKVDLDAPVEIEPRGRNSIAVVHDTDWRRRRDIGRVLMKLCKPAPFGDGGATRHDTRVRRGGQLSAARGAFAVHGLDLVGTGILGEIHRALCPGDARPPKAELYALNVYREGGHFVTHKDTPRDRDMLGTLVVCLPVPFSGGRLMLRHETVRSFDWQNRRDFYRDLRETQDYAVRWAAFYGDVDHEVERVDSGARVTLTWLLRRGSKASVALPSPSTEASELDCEGALVAALEDPGFLPRGGTLGVPCVHLYAEEPGLVRPAAGLSQATAGRLKGRDGMIARAALRMGLQTRFRPYLFETCANESWRLARAPTAQEARFFRGGRLGASDLEAVMPIEQHVDWNSEDDVTWVLPPPWDAPDAPDPARDVLPATALLGEVDYSATDYFGNEGGDTAFYVSAVLLLVVPRASQRPTSGPSKRRRNPARS